MQSENPQSPSDGAPPGRNTWRIVLGVAFIVTWVTVAVALFYTIAVSGILAEIFLAILRPILFPGTSGNQTDMLTWVPSMRVSLILAGAAGIPAGLAIFWQSCRTSLLGTFALLLLSGLLCGLYSLWTMLSSFAG